MRSESSVVEAVAEVYAWLDSQLAGSGRRCDACGKCCDFESFGHRLFVTTPEIIYFANRILPAEIKQMAGGICPYNDEGKCGAYTHRFAACRIFSCTDDADIQSRLSETSLQMLKSVCSQGEIPYRYMDLKTALNEAAQIKGRS